MIFINYLTIICINYFQCPKPVIAAIHGACVGGATNMVAFADIRYCTNDAWFQVKEAMIGKQLFTVIPPIFMN